MQPTYNALQSPFQQLAKGTVLKFVAIFWNIPGPFGVCVTSNILKLLSQKVVAKIGMFVLEIH
jgi:hypothetical protein